MQFLGEGPLHILDIADAVVHKMELSFEHKEVIKYPILIHYFLIVIDLNQWHLIVQLNDFK